MTHSTTPPIVLTKATVPGALGIIGPTETLQAAYETQQPVTLDGKLVGEVVYLGHRRQVFDPLADGVTVERVGLDRHIGETPKYPGIDVAVYLVDLTRLDQAPTIAELARTARNRSMANAVAAEVWAAEDDERREHDSEDGA